MITIELDEPLEVEFAGGLWFFTQDPSHKDRGNGREPSGQYRL